MDGAVLVGDTGLLLLPVVAEENDVGGIDRIGIDFLLLERESGDVRIGQRGTVDVLCDLVTGDRIFGNYGINAAIIVLVRTKMFVSSSEPGCL